MKLSELKPVKGSRKKRNRVGRGAGSGNGKTCGTGHNGQKSRSGGSIAAGFEGGQMPLQRRLPKSGFTNIFRVEYEVINLDTLEKMKLSGDVTPTTLAERGLIGRKSKLKVLGRGELTSALTITAARFSKTAVEKIEKAGGKAVVA